MKFVKPFILLLLSGGVLFITISFFFLNFDKALEISDLKSHIQRQRSDMGFLTTIIQKSLSGCSLREQDLVLLAKSQRIGMGEFRHREEKKLLVGAFSYEKDGDCVTAIKLNAYK